MHKLVAQNITVDGRVKKGEQTMRTLKKYANKRNNRFNRKLGGD